MTAPPESFRAAPARPVLLRLVDTDPDPEADESPVDWRGSPLAVLPALDPTADLDLVDSLVIEQASPRLGDRGSATITPEQGRSVAAAVVRRLLEVLDGRRPARQLGTVLVPRVLSKLEATPRTTTGGGLRLRTVHVCLPGPATIEACAVVQAGRRCRAFALRLEQTGTSWKCTALHIG